MSQKVIARFSVDQAGEMTEQGRKEIADWLRQQAEALEEEGHNYSTNFVARYICDVREPAHAEQD
ncbi:hypothetical protein EVB41_083 [Rhizobium phage RHph_TM3_14A]|nr:hypothetical protein EVB29_084 [Rhizobium phage RHph_TM27A]QIG67004.1 hypothetical protein EVB30_084 [Rhizobium phage RHph_TM27B]QIG67092.1 hypothetical protein EVB31_082 [Rhizobium phage RHph_TM29]QIG67548.1 hypothetical protein EVB41_083 [Rhizobium phage RHph_TM3_14A]